MVISNLNIKLIEDRLGIINKGIYKLKRLSDLNENLPDMEDFVRSIKTFIERYREQI